MKVTRITVLAGALFLLMTVSVSADSIWGSYRGYDRVKVNVNDHEVSIPYGGVPGFVIGGSTVLPVRQVSEGLSAIVEWDGSNNTVNLYKPNVHLFFADYVNDDMTTLKGIFGAVKQGKSRSFYVVAQIDDLRANASGYRITVEDPDGNEVASQEASIDSSNNIWYAVPLKVRFDESGTYTVKFAYLDKGDYFVVAKKSIISN